MKRNILAITVALAGLLFSLNASAQKPIWLVGHACNSHQCLMDAIEDGANGVEIDIVSDDANKGKDWSVNHNGGFLDSDKRKSWNRNRKETVQYVSLKEYLDFPEMDKLCILWLDVKSGQYLADLVIYVNKLLEDRYKDKKGNVNVPYSIIFGVYDLGDVTRAASVLKENMWPNEGFGLACEGKEKGQYATASISKLEQILINEHGLPIGQHIMTSGWGWPAKFTSGSVYASSLREAKKLKEEGKYCIKTGAWSMEKPHHGLQLLCSREDTRYYSYETECDLILIECRNEFVPAKLFPTIFNPNALNDFYVRFFDRDGKWYKSYNNGKYRLAWQSDKFYK